MKMEISANLYCAQITFIMDFMEIGLIINQLLLNKI